MLHVWMYVLGSVESAAANCLKYGDNSPCAKAWDDAVALYVGSGALKSGREGYFVYTLIQDICCLFRHVRRGGQGTRER
jgi:hypothetical protein